MSHEHRHNPERYYDDEGDEWDSEPLTWDRCVCGAPSTLACVCGDVFDPF